jgi:hypothetical protein
MFENKLATGMAQEKIIDNNDARHPGESAPAPERADPLAGTANSLLTEDLALALLKRGDLSAEDLEQLSKNVDLLKSRKVKLAIASHPHTPRHVSVPLARQFYIFDLMKVALAPAVPADIKVAVDDILISRLKTVALGERLTLARRASGRVAAALLLDLEAGEGKTTPGHRDGELVAGTVNTSAIALAARVLHTALENPRLTEVLVINSVLSSKARAALVDAIAHHPMWSKRREIRAALLRTEHLSLACALDFSREIPTSVLRELLASSRLPARIKDQLLRESDRENPE